MLNTILSYFAAYIVGVWCGYFLTRVNLLLMTDARDYWRWMAHKQQRRGNQWFDEYVREANGISQEDWER
jgi:membrane protein DedA with SNARE-associated domain